jgi:hypothetical protein
MSSQAITRGRQLKNATEKVQVAASKFKGALTEDQKKEFRILEKRIAKSPDAVDILQLTQALDRRHSSRHGSEKRYTNRLMEFLTELQPLLQGIDVAVGGTQNIILCSVWGALKICLQVSSIYASWRQETQTDMHRLPAIDMSSWRNSQIY